jgi:hypothetical protein
MSTMTPTSGMQAAFDEIMTTAVNARMNPIAELPLARKKCCRIAIHAPEDGAAIHAPRLKLDTLHAYLAGIIDIDGYISITRTAMHRGDPPVYYYNPTIGIGHPSAMVADLFQEAFPARRHEFHPKDSEFTCWHWWWAQHENARKALLCLKPFLRLKRRQAELSLALFDLFDSQKKREGRKLSDEQHAARQRLYEEVLRLNGPRVRKYRQRARPPT